MYIIVCLYTEMHHWEAGAILEFLYEDKQLATLDQCLTLLIQPLHCNHVRVGKCKRNNPGSPLVAKRPRFTEQPNVPVESAACPQTISSEHPMNQKVETGNMVENEDRVRGKGFFR